MQFFLTITYPASSSKNLSKAISLSKRVGDLQVAGKTSEQNRLSLTKEEFASKCHDVERLWFLVRGWKGSELILEGSQVQWGDIHPTLEVIQCGKRYESAVIQENHCRIDDGKFGWGCVFLHSIDRDLPEYHYHLRSQRYWFQFGHFSSPTEWTIEKEAILNALQREAKLKKLGLCPVFNFEKAKTAVTSLPDSIDLEHTDSWAIAYEEQADGQTIERKPIGIVPQKLGSGFGSVTTKETQTSNTEERVEFGDEDAPLHTRYIPTVKFSDIGGIDEILQTIREVIELPLKRPEIFQHLGVKPHKGILLYGPPGCGKTLIAKAIANEVNAHFISVKGPELLSKWHGESEENLRNIFEEARTLQPAVIFFDEIDSVAQARSSAENIRLDSRFVNQLLTLMDGIEDYANVRVIGSTNRPELLDEALLRPGRFDYTIEVKHPTRQGCAKIFAIQTRHMPLDSQFDLEVFTKHLEGLSGAEIAFVAREGAYNCLRRSVDIHSAINNASFAEIDCSTMHIGEDDFVLALDKVRRPKQE